MKLLDDPIALLGAAITQSFNAVIITDANHEDGGPKIVFCNPAFCEMTGYSKAELIGQSPRILQGPETDPRIIAKLRRCLAAGEYFRDSAINYRKNGTPYHVEWNISPVRNAEGEITHFVSVQQNISDRIAAEQQRDMLAEAINATPDSVIITDTRSRILFVNNAFEQTTGYKLREIKGLTPSILRSGENNHPFYADMYERLINGNVVRHTFLNKRKNGELYFADQSIVALKSKAGKLNYYVSIGKDISDQIEKEQLLKNQAHRDELTGLFNRRYGEILLSNQQKKVLTHNQACSVILCDIDRFKTINDNFGHACGDDILKRVTAEISNSLRSADAIIRWGGDEILLLLPNTGLQSAYALAERICDDVANRTYPEVGKVTLSMGVASWLAGERKRGILSRADDALYRAKENGRNGVQADLSSRTEKSNA